MSERGSFTTEYIYNEDDYKVIRKALDQKSKYLCVCPPAKWSDGDKVFEMPIVSGKVGGLAYNTEWLEISEALRGVKTEKAVKLIVMCEGEEIVLISKSPDGQTEEHWLEEIEK